MFGYRTPAKARHAEPSRKSSSPKPATNVRRSVGEWEASVNSNPPAGKAACARTPSPTPTPLAIPPGTKKAARRDQGEKTDRAPFSPKLTLPTASTPGERAQQARSWFGKGHTALNESRNLKGDLKATLIQALNHLYKLYKEAEAQSGAPKGESGPSGDGIAEEAPGATWQKELRENTQQLREHRKEMGELKEAMAKYESTCTKPTYAGAVKECPSATPLTGTTLHSVVVRSKDETETGDEVLDRVRKALNAKEGWVQVERVRKAKDQKVIMGCGTKEERDKVRRRLEESNTLIVEEAKNRDPLLILRDVMTIHSDEEIVGALRKQNRAVLGPLDNEEDRMEVKYRRKARNPHNCHIVLTVSPKIWGAAVAAGKLKVDLQNVRVEDQTPLVQCTRCLGFGHSKRFCRDAVDLCGHCGGPHLRGECADWLAAVPPSCKNCTRAKSQQVDHNAFSEVCPVRKRWDTIARAAVAYS